MSSSKRTLNLTVIHSTPPDLPWKTNAIWATRRWRRSVYQPKDTISRSARLVGGYHMGGGMFSISDPCLTFWPLARLSYPLWKAIIHFCVRDSVRNPWYQSLFAPRPHVVPTWPFPRVWLTYYMFPAVMRMHHSITHCSFACQYAHASCLVRACDFKTPATLLRPFSEP